MDGRILAAFTQITSAFLAPVLIAGGIVVGLAHGRYSLVTRPEAAPVVDPTPQPAPAQPTVVVVTAPALPAAPLPPADPGPPAPEVVTIGYSEVNDWLGVADTTRAEVLLLLDDAGALASKVRILPYLEHGRVSGVKLYGVRSDSALAAFGLRNGDVVRTVNGIPLTSPDASLEAYSRLREADFVDVRLTRRGREARLLVLIHDA